MNHTVSATGIFRLRRRLVGVLLVVPLLGSCSDATGPILTFWEGDLDPIRPSFVGGRVVAVTQHGRTLAGIAIEDGEPGVTYGWRIDSGTCAEPGEIQGGPVAYPPLLPGQSGSASAETSLSALFKSGRRFAGRVFLTLAGGSEQIVACGNLDETSG